MRSPAEIWRQRLWVWVPALVFFLANATAYTIYRFGFADRVASLQEDLKDQRERLDPLDARRQKLQALLTSSKRTDQEIRKLYAESFSTRRARLTNINTEVKTLARKAGLDPRSFSYPEEQIQQYGLIKRSFIFSVEGSYVNLRKFINLLELSDSFLTLESINLTPGTSERQGRGRAGAAPAPAPSPESSELRISLTLSTLFARDPNDPGPLVRRTAS
jgi:Tfp pilus assembly protein PilO